MHKTLKNDELEHEKFASSTNKNPKYKSNGGENVSSETLKCKNAHNFMY